MKTCMQHISLLNFVIGGKGQEQNPQLSIAEGGGLKNADIDDERA